MSNNQNSTEVTESQMSPATNGNHINQTTQNCGPVDPSIKINPSRLRRLEESSQASSNVTPSTRNESSNSAPQNANSSTTSIASSATLYAPSLSATTLQGSTNSDPTTPEPRTFKTGHGVCCNPDLMKRCLEHGEVEGEKLDEGNAGDEVIDRQISGYTGPTETELKTEEEREAARERIRERLARIQ